jgi:hypothetical protein
MSKKQFIALADAIRIANDRNPGTFSELSILALAAFCKTMNPAFMVNRWLDYVAGRCGPNGGAIKP